MAHEGARERELHRHYQPWLETFHATDLPVIPYKGASRLDGHLPQSSTDKALTSFAQLGALRLGGKRGVVTLIDGSQQYVLAEATKTLSLMDDSIHDPGDELWLGNAMIPRGQGMSEQALRPPEYTATDPDGTTFTAPAMVILDATLDDRFKSRGVAGSGVSFYAGVPLMTRLGHPIGVYNVTDNKPRAGLNAQELRFLVDMSSIVVQHLEIIKNERARARGERLVQGIGAFIEGCRSSSAFADQEDSFDRAESLSVNGTSKEKSQNHLQRPSMGSRKSSGGFKGLTISNANTVGRKNYSNFETEDPLTSARDQHQPQGPDADIYHRDPSKEPKMDGTLGSENGESSKTDAAKPPVNLQDAKCQRERVFGRAAKILRRSLGADGIVFLDASSANLSQGTQGREKGASKTSTAKQPQTSADGAPNPISAVHMEATAEERETEDSFSDDLAYQGKKSRSARLNQPCDFVAGSIQNTQSQTPLRLSQRSLAKLLRRYPLGKCYTFDENGRLASSDEGSGSAVSAEAGLDTTALSDTSRGSHKSSARKHPLRNLLPGTRTVVFLPLWDFTRDRWNSAAIIWSSHPARLMNIQDDSAYLAAFGNSVMNELARLNLLVSDSAKANFLANISHELRSPLHGILGSIEFLHESPLDDFQSNMVINVETCGKTLLDTINHGSNFRVLDFTKLNNLSKAGQRGVTQATTSDSSLTSTFDLAVIVEEAVEAVYAGQVFRTANADALEGRGPPLSSYNRAISQRQDSKAQIALGQAALSSDVQLTLNIDDGTNWHVASQPGAIRRIVMNLLGNALKYTDRGSINVSLQLDESRQHDDDSYRHALLIVADTGKGMSEDFVKNHAFTAFSQENSLTSGTGLGLSIIRQIVESLGGKIDMRSQKGVGTEIKIWLSLQIMNTAPERNTLHQVQERTGGLMMCLLDPRGEYTPANESSASEPRMGLGKRWAVDESLRDLTTQWFSMHVFTAPNMDNVTADFFVYAEPPPIEYLLHQHGQNGSDSETPVLVFCQNAFQANSLRANGIHHLTEIGRIIEVVARPVGPQKLAKVLQRCFQRNKKLDSPTGNYSGDQVPRRVRGSDELRAPPPHARKPSKETTLRASRADQNGAQGVVPLIRPGLAHRQTAPSPNSPQKPLRVKAQPSFSEDGMKDPTVPRVLVVDDNDINLQLLVAFVRKAKLSFEPASDGLQALEAYRRCAFSNALRFKYVVMDISMPVMDGITACREIRKFEKQESMEPAQIIALTGMGEESDIKEEAKEAGFTKFLAKPIRFQVLREMLI